MIWKEEIWKAIERELYRTGVLAQALSGWIYTMTGYSMQVPCHGNNAVDRLQFETVEVSRLYRIESN